MPFNKFYKLKANLPYVITPFYDDDKPFFSFTNFSLHPITDPKFPGKIFPTSEHYFQAMKIYESPHYPQKFRDDYIDNILNNSSPSHALATAWKVSMTPQAIEDWEQRKMAVMNRALDLKLDQYPQIAADLQSTQNTCLVEDTAKRVVLDPKGQEEKLWGWGSDGQGQNLLGMMLMKKRNKLHLAAGNTKWVVPSPEQVYKAVQQERLDPTVVATIQQTRAKAEQALIGRTKNPKAEAMGLQYSFQGFDTPQQALAARAVMPSQWGTSTPNTHDLKNRYDNLHNSTQGLQQNGLGPSAATGTGIGSTGTKLGPHAKQQQRQPAVRITGITLEEFQKVCGGLKIELEKGTQSLSVSELPNLHTFSIKRVKSVPDGTEMAKKFQKIEDAMRTEYNAEYDHMQIQLQKAEKIHAQTLENVKFSAKTEGAQKKKEMELAEKVFQLNMDEGKTYQLFMASQAELVKLQSMRQEIPECVSILQNLQQAISKINEEGNKCVEVCKILQINENVIEENIQRYKESIQSVKNAQKQYDEIMKTFKAMKPMKAVSEPLADISYKPQEKQVDVKFNDASTKPEEIKSVLEGLKELTENKPKADVTLYGCQNNRELAQNLAIQAMINLKRAPKFHATTTAEFFKQNPKELQLFCEECKKAIDERLNAVPPLTEEQKTELRQIYNQMLDQNKVAEILAGKTAIPEKFPEPINPAAAASATEDAAIVITRSTPRGNPSS